uniref:Uncharacterized protein n=1 Tax=Myripristis murdjan TaxID=586833 RepID=A0A667YSX1_9TELE
MASFGRTSAKPFGMKMSLRQAESVDTPPCCAATPISAHLGLPKYETVRPSAHSSAPLGELDLLKVSAMHCPKTIIIKLFGKVRRTEVQPPYFFFKFIIDLTASLSFCPSFISFPGSLHIYNICRYLMTMNFSAQVLEFLLWASISVELSIPLMTVKYLPWMVTLYCAVCQCYYDIQAAVQAEVFARRALGKINELAKLEEQSGVPATRETQRAYKEASIKLATMLFKRAVYEPRKRPKGMFRAKTKGNLKDIPNVPWPRTTTEHVLIELYDSSAAQFLGILEALWDSSRRPLQTGMPDEPELQEVVLELLSAGISILGG